MPFVELRIFDDVGAPLHWDGRSTGEIEVRGPWIASGYYREQAPEKFDDGWLRTGDIAHVAPAGGVADDDFFDDKLRANAFHEQETVVREVFVNPGSDIPHSREADVDLLHCVFFEGA